MSYHFISNQHELGSGFWNTFATNGLRGLLTFHRWKVSQQPHVQCVPQSQGNGTNGSGKWKRIDVKATSKLKSSDVSHLPTWVPNWFCRLGFWKLCACRQLGSIDQATTTNDLGQVASKHPKTTGGCKDLPSIPALVLGTFCQTL